MILDNLNFDFTTPTSILKANFLLAYNTDMQLLFNKQLKQENIKGCSIAQLDIINYWAAFVLCIIIQHEMVVSNDITYTTYNDLYDLDTIALTLQKVNIDITKVYGVFSLFGYSN